MKEGNSSNLAIVKGYQFVINYKLILLVGLAIGVVLGLSVSLISKEKYKSEATFTSPYITNNNSELLFALIKTNIGAPDALAELMNVTPEVAASLLKLELDYTINPMFMNQELPDETYFNVEITIRDKESLAAIEKGLLYYLNNKVPYLITKRDNYLDSRKTVLKGIEHSLSLVNTIDSLNSEGKMKDFGTVSLFSTSDVLEFQEEMLIKTRMSNCAYLVMEFTPIYGKSWPKPWLLMPGGGFVGLAMAVFFALLLDFIKIARRG